MFRNPLLKKKKKKKYWIRSCYNAFNYLGLTPFFADKVYVCNLFHRFIHSPSFIQ